MTSLNELSSTISVNVDQITKYLDTHRLPPPSFHPDSPSTLPADPLVQRARLALIEAASALTNLAIGSADFTRWQVLEASPFFCTYLMRTKLWRLKGRESQTLHC